VGHFSDAPRITPLYSFFGLLIHVLQVDILAQPKMSLKERAQEIYVGLNHSFSVGNLLYQLFEHNIRPLNKS
jgi:hypothetical protein